MAVLRQLEPFQSFSDEKLKEFALEMEGAEVEAGELIIQQGDAGEEFFIIEHGTALVEHKNDPKDELERPRILAELKDGAHFGEIALVTDEPRSASIRAKEDMKVLKMHLP